MVRPKKHLGQHFLHDRSIAERIAALVPDEAGCVLEIGPGTGVLTRHLLPRFGQKLHLVEIDGESVAYLREHFELSATQLLHQDFLKLDLRQFQSEKMVIAGNFPYNISSQIFFHILDAYEQVEEVVCMIQLEVAQRIAAPAGSRTYGILSVLLQAWYDIGLKFEVGPGAFIPPPKVRSAVVHLKRNHSKNLGCDEDSFRRLVKQAFNQRRKTLRNALGGLVPREASHPLLEKRAEQLEVQDFAELTAWADSLRTKG
ncbi:MAG: ribosomal RNA small subunit methyltransferase A [Bacteroidetes bacterium]|nr:ribosomal RNA small subunit methyltransferase A [Bacteroidota bacterium]